MRVRLCFALLLAIVSLGEGITAERQVASTRPALVVVLVVDQMRTDYIERYGRHFTHGLKRLLDQGMWFRRAAYPYLNTVTCAGHATIGTGTLPHRHGMILNRWWDRTSAATRSCSDDATARNLGYTVPSRGGDSAHALLTPTLSEYLRTSARGRSVVLSQKARSAIALAGQGESTVVWLEGSNWVTSTAFANAPAEWLKRFIEASPVTADNGKVWERMLPLAKYAGADEVKGERSPNGWTPIFPHPIGVPQEQFDAQWQRSPFADDYLARMAVHALDALELGRGPGVDYLGISFSALDLIGHQYGPHSHEVQDALFRLDVTIGRLLDALDSRVGRRGYVLGLSADHGVSPLPELSGGGRQTLSAISGAVDKALQPVLGPGKYVAHVEYTDVYLAPGIAERVRKTPAAWPAIRAALLDLPGISRVLRAEDVAPAEARRSSDPAVRAAALSHHPGRSGDIIVIPAEYWLLSSSAATHGTLHDYDQRVPVLLFGPGIPAAVLDTPASPADLAPSLAAAAGVPFATPDGRVLIPTLSGPARVE